MISRRRVLETMAAALAAARPWATSSVRRRRPQASAQTAHTDRPGLALYPHLFSPLTFSNLTVKNRVFRSNISGRFDNYDGSGNQARINWEVKFARGGVGAVISSFVPVAMRGRIMPNYATIDRDDAHAVLEEARRAGPRRKRLQVHPAAEPRRPAARRARHRIRQGPQLDRQERPAARLRVRADDGRADSGRRQGVRRRARGARARPAPTASSCTAPTATSSRSS